MTNRKIPNSLNGDAKIVLDGDLLEVGGKGGAKGLNCLLPMVPEAPQHRLPQHSAALAWGPGPLSS